MGGFHFVDLALAPVAVLIDVPSPLSSLLLLILGDAPATLANFEEAGEQLNGRMDFTSISSPIRGTFEKLCGMPPVFSNSLRRISF